MLQVKRIVVSVSIIVFSLHLLSFATNVVTEQKEDYLALKEMMEWKTPSADIITDIILGKVVKIRKILFFEHNIIRMYKVHDLFLDYKAKIEVLSVFKGNLKKKDKIRFAYMNERSVFKSDRIFSIGDEYLFFIYESYSYRCCYINTYHEVRGEDTDIFYFGILKKEGDYLLFPKKTYTKRTKEYKTEFVKLPYSSVIRIIEEHVAERNKKKKEQPASNPDPY